MFSICEIHQNLYVYSGRREGVRKKRRKGEYDESLGNIT